MHPKRYDDQLSFPISGTLKQQAQAISASLGTNVATMLRMELVLVCNEILDDIHPRNAATVFMQSHRLSEDFGVKDDQISAPVSLLMKSRILRSAENLRAATGFDFKPAHICRAALARAVTKYQGEQEG